MSIYQYGPTNPTIPGPEPEITVTQVGAPPRDPSPLPETGSDILLLVALGVVLILGGLLLATSKRTRIGSRR